MESLSKQEKQYVKSIKQQLLMLKEGKKDVIGAVDHRINQVESEVDTYVKGGVFNLANYAQICKRIQEILKLFIDKSGEISGAAEESYTPPNVLMRIAKLEQAVDSLTNVDVKLNRLEDENKSVNVSMKELNKEISSVRTCSNDALMSIQDLSKSVESTNQHYNEMSDKMNELKISISLMLTQFTEKLENMGSYKKEKSDDLKDSIEKLVAEMSNKITEIERNCNLPKIGFCARKSITGKVGHIDITSYDKVDANHGDHFDESSGIFTAPLQGLYLISIMARNGPDTKKNGITCHFILKETTGLKLHRVKNNETVTRLLEITEGEKLYLKWNSIDENDTNDMHILFSCHLMQM